MRAILLAAGFGTRLRPFTEHFPKCLAPIRGRPLLDVWLANLTAAGVGPFLVNTHYLSVQVEQYVNSSPYSDAVTLVHEEKLLGTAGTLLENIDFYGDHDGLLIHADNYCLADIAGFLDAHNNRPDECLMTMMTFRTDTPASCGIVELDDRGVVTGFHEKVAEPPGNLANGAIYILSSELLRLMRNKFSSVTDFSTQVLPKLVGAIYTYETDELLVDIGTPETFKWINSC